MNYARKCQAVLFEFRVAHICRLISLSGSESSTSRGTVSDQLVPLSARTKSVAGSEPMTVSLFLGQ